MLKKKSVQQLKKAADEKREEFNRKIKESNKKARLDLVKRAQSIEKDKKVAKDMTIQEKKEARDALKQHREEVMLAKEINDAIKHLGQIHTVAFKD